MTMHSVEKVTAEHLKRDAYLYVRQSTLKQVIENTESTKRQYALRSRAVALGWAQEQVVVIDSDLGESAAPGAADRAGFERLMTDVSMGRAGLVMGLEVSRLARSCSAWHRLLEICALTHTLVLDQDGLYDVGHINDRLLLGLKAAMSEAELHMIRERQRERDRVVIDQEKREKILSLSRDFPALWRNPKTPQRERKRMARLLIEDVTLVKNAEFRVGVRFKGGATRLVTLPRPIQSCERWKTDNEVIAQVDRLLDDHTYAEIAAILNEKGYVSGKGRIFNSRRVGVIRRAYDLRDRYTRLHAQGCLSVKDVATKLGICVKVVQNRRANGTLPVGHRKLNDQGGWMYEDPDTGKDPKTAEMPVRTIEV